MEISSRDLRLALIDKKLSAKDLAAKLGISDSSVYQWTGGYKKIPTSYYSALKEILGIQEVDSSNEDEGPVDKIPENLKILREKRNLTQDDLAAKLGLSRQQIWRWENGASRPTQHNLDKLANVLGTSVGILTGKNISFNYTHRNVDPNFMIPVYGTVPDDKHIEFNSESEEYRIPAGTVFDPDELFAVEASGSSMMPRIEHKDTLIFRKSTIDPLPPKDVQVVSSDRFSKYLDRIVLVQHNNKCFVAMLKID